MIRGEGSELLGAKMFFLPNVQPFRKVGITGTGPSFESSLGMISGSGFLIPQNGYRFCKGDFMLYSI